MGFFPTVVGGLEVRERPKRHPNEPRYKRLDFVRTKVEKDDWKLVKAVYKGHPENLYDEKDDEVVEVKEVAPHLLTFQQWEHANGEFRRRQHEIAMREQQDRMRAQQEHEFRMRMQQQNFMQQQQQQIPPPLPLPTGVNLPMHPGPAHHHQGHPQGSRQQPGFTPPRMIDNQQRPQIIDITLQDSSDSSDDEYYVKEVRPRHNRGPPVPVMQDDIYSDDEDLSPLRRSRSRRRRPGS